MTELGWIAFLRGINVGGHNRLPMADLRRVCEQHGCSSVTTYIQSGNVLFWSDISDHAALGRLLEGAIETNLGVSTPVVLRTFTELGQVAGSHPFGADTSRSHVSFLAGSPRRDGGASLAEVDVAPDRFELRGSDVFLQYPNGVHGSRLTPALLERHLGVAGTVRNWRTVTRLAELAETG